jgi:hypothetical protein
MQSFALALVLLSAPAQKVLAPTPALAAPGPRVEVAFVLDTTGSMGGLIDGAKRRIWSIARRIGEGQPRPDLAIAIVGYRDRGDEYVTRVHDLTGDMDLVYRNLMAFQAGGHYARIDSQGGMPVRVTPMDAELAKLNAELATTVVAGGSVDEQAAAGRRLEARAAMPAPMAAEAASYFAKEKRLAEKDLVTLSEPEQKREVQALRAQPGSTPAALQGKSDDEAVGYLKEQKARRDRIQSRILDLQKQRDALLTREAPARDGFDEQVLASLRAKAAGLGIRY